MAANFDTMANEMAKMRLKSQFSTGSGADERQPPPRSHSMPSNPTPVQSDQPPPRPKAKANSSKRAQQEGRVDTRRPSRNSSEPPRQPNMGAYRFTSLLQKMQRWKTHVTAAVVELEKPMAMPHSANDPAWCQETMDACWQTSKIALEEMVKSAASVISIIQHSANISGAIDFPAVEKKLIRMLKQVKPLVTAIRTVAMLDDTPGLGKSLTRRTKTICRNITGFMKALETSTSDLKGTVVRATTAASELDESCKLVLKHAYGGVETAKQNRLDQEQRKKKARDYERSSAHAKKEKRI